VGGDDILDLIDHAIRASDESGWEYGWESGAMRWSPALDADEHEGRRHGYCSPPVPAFVPPPPAGPVGLEVWTDPATGRRFIAPLGTPLPDGTPETLSPWIAVDVLEQLAEHLGEHLSDFIAMVLRAVRAFGEYLGEHIVQAIARTEPVSQQLEAAGVLEQQPPADPAARALWLRQHRNTGPTQRPRAPRRIDPRRAR
jgi:hypothetical protein